jgi:LDH2 family malate/lactate/ureidoglycolate dehydrogenase
MTDRPDAAIEVGVDALSRFGNAAYRSVGLRPDDAETVIGAQLDADLRGVDTHGFQRLPWYVDHLREKRNNPRPHFEVLRESSSSVLLDADNALGQLACVRLVEHLIPKAEVNGLAIGTMRNSNDWGCGAYYPRLAAAAGFICFATTTSVPTLAPYGGRTRVLGNNPMVFAVPRRGLPPVVLDMALTPVALGKVMRAIAEDEPIPEEWGFLDSDGRPTTDAGAALGGVIPAIGGYKGTGLAFMMNVLAGVLPGGTHGAGVGVGRRGQFAALVSPSLFGETDGFLDGVESTVAQVKAAELLPGADGPYLPGELEDRRSADARARGTIRYPRSVARELSRMADSQGIEAPPGLRRLV